ncbi:MAG TPA: DUF1465 family protein [Ancylobacter sp.]
MAEFAERDMKAVSLAQRRIASQAFTTLFLEGMALVEQTATYLDGDGRNESRDLPRPALHAYAQQSMRLSTRLMQLASWLLLQRAVTEDEMTPADARRESAKIDLEGPARDEEAEAMLPEGLRALIGRSFELQRRIRQLNGALTEPTEEQRNPVAGQIGRLRTAFERR